MNARDRRSLNLFFNDPAGWSARYPKRAARLRRDLAKFLVRVGLIAILEAFSAEVPMNVDSGHVEITEEE